MSTPRRRVLRPRPPADDVRRQRQIERCRTRLVNEQEQLRRWMARLKRAFHAVEKQQGRIARLEKRILQLEREPS